MMGYIVKNKVRMHDTDAAGILYFARIYRFANDTLEDFLHSQGIDFFTMPKEKHFMMVIVHSEANYYKMLHVSEEIEIDLKVSKIGNSSFEFNYDVYRIEKETKTLTGNVKTVHCCIDADTKIKIPIPISFRELLERFK